MDRFAISLLIKIKIFLSYLIIICKTENTANKNNYRPISLATTCSKIFVAVAIMAIFVAITLSIGDY